MAEIIDVLFMANTLIFHIKKLLRQRCVRASGPVGSRPWESALLSTRLVDYLPGNWIGEVHCRLPEF